MSSASAIETIISLQVTNICTKMLQDHRENRKTYNEKERREDPLFFFSLIWFKCNACIQTELHFSVFPQVSQIYNFWT